MHCLGRGKVWKKRVKNSSLCLGCLPVNNVLSPSIDTLTSMGMEREPIQLSGSPFPTQRKKGNCKRWLPSILIFSATEQNKIFYLVKRPKGQISNQIKKIR